MKTTEQREQQEEIKFWHEMEEPLDAEVIVTRHGKKRVRERICKSSSIVEKAFRLGLTEHQATGQLQKYIKKQHMKKGTANNVRVFNHFIYIFCDRVFVTAYKLPRSLQKIEDKIKQRQTQFAS